MTSLITLVDLPIEIYLEIINNLNVIKNYVSISAVNKYSNQIIYSLVLVNEYKKLYKYTHNVFHPKFNFKENLLINNCRFLTPKTSILSTRTQLLADSTDLGKTQTKEIHQEIMLSLLRTNNYCCECIHHSVDLCCTLGSLLPLKILHNFYSNKKISSGCEGDPQYLRYLISPDKQLIKKNFRYALYHQHYDIADWLIETHSEYTYSEKFVNQINEYILFGLFLDDKMDAILHLLYIKSHYNLPILSWQIIVKYLFSENRLTREFYSTMQILYDSIKSEIPEYYGDISRDFLLNLCINGHIGYLDFLLQIVNKHKMMSESDLVSLIKEGFLEGCTFGRFELVQTLYANCTSSTTGLEMNPKYGVKVFFGEDLQKGFDLCLAESKGCVDILAKPYTHYLEIIKWLHQLSRQPGYNPINITYDMIYDKIDDYRMRYPEDITACLEMLILENVIE